MVLKVSQKPSFSCLKKSLRYKESDTNPINKREWDVCKKTSRPSFLSSFTWISDEEWTMTVQDGHLGHPDPKVKSGPDRPIDPRPKHRVIPYND